jgi:putative addiction module antidote
MTRAFVFSDRFSAGLVFQTPQLCAPHEAHMKIEIKKIGNSDGLLLPKELMQRLDLKRGQELHITELPGGGFQAMPYDPDFERTMEIADEVMDKYKDTLAALAK